MTHWRLAMAVAMTAVAVAAAAAASGQVKTEELPDTHETVYRIVVAPAATSPPDRNATGSCTLSWTLSRTAPNRNVAQQRVVNCPALPLTSLLTGVDQIIASLEQREPDRLPTLDTLFLGNLSNYPEIAGRLGQLAALSKDWDPVHGRPKSGSTTVVAFVERIAKQPEFLAGPGLDEVFRRHRIQIEVSSVENVRIVRASTLPDFENLKRNGVRPDSRIPANCLMWIRLKYPKEGAQQ